tara:strand:- start:2015 stop:2764 length:750 start_codon:yes stop_codon:yes gene_type:complete
MSINRFKKGKHKIYQEKVESFFDSQVQNNNDFSSNLQKSKKLSSQRDLNEYGRVISKLTYKFDKLNTKIKVLDLGCGIGRLAKYFLNSEIYFGIDFSENSIEFAKQKFKKNQNIIFSRKIIPQELDLIIPKHEGNFNVILISGLMLYMNDELIKVFFKKILKFASNECVIYFREPISLLWERLTLKDHFSDELNSKYSAIYRTVNEYEVFFKYLTLNQFICHDCGELLGEELKNRIETSQYFWVYNRYN